MRKAKRILTLGLVTTLIVTSVSVMAFADPLATANTAPAPTTALTPATAYDNYDMNGDGVLDAVDINGDGVVDYIDVDGDGIAETPVTDTDGDGIPDTHALLADSDGDGNPDQHAGHVDTTGDGNLDSIAPGPAIGQGVTVDTTLTAPGPVVQQLPQPNESVNVTTKQLSNNTGATLSYSVDNNLWSVGTTQNPIDISSAFGGGVLYVKYLGNGTTTSDSPVQTITWTIPSLQKEPTPQAVFDALSMTLTNMNVGMAYCFDGATWTTIGEGSPLSKTLSMDDANNALAHRIQVKKLGNGSTTTDSDVQMLRYIRQKHQAMSRQ